MIQDAARSGRSRDANRVEDRSDARRHARLLGRRAPHGLHGTHQKRLYDRVDEDDSFLARANFGILIYPGGVVDKDGKLKPEFEVKQDTPPMFSPLVGRPGIERE